MKGQPDNEKENFIQKRKLTNATDPEVKLRAANVDRAPENSPNRKVRTYFSRFPYLELIYIDNQNLTILEPYLNIGWSLWTLCLDLIVINDN